MSLQWTKYRSNQWIHLLNEMPLNLAKQEKPEKNCIWNQSQGKGNEKRIAGNFFLLLVFCWILNRNFISFRSIIDSLRLFVSYFGLSMSAILLWHEKCPVISVASSNCREIGIDNKVSYKFIGLSHTKLNMQTKFLSKFDWFPFGERENNKQKR